MSTLVIRLAGPQDPARWMRVAEDGALEASGVVARPFDGQLSETGAGRVVVLVPGADAVAHLVDLPAAGEAQTRAAARFAVEDELAVPADEVHLALAPAAPSGGPRLAAAVAQAAMARFLADARALGAAPDAMAPEWAALPAEARTASVLVLEDQAHVRIDGPAARGGFSAEPDLAAAILDRALDRFDCARAHIWGPAASVAPSSGWAGRELAEHALPDAAAADHIFARGVAAGAPAINLLQGPYAPRRAGAFGFAPWRRAAALAAAALLLWLGLTVAETRAVNARADALTAEAEAVFAEAFPEVGRIVNPRLQLQTELAALRGRSGGAFLDQAAILVGAIAAREGVEVAAMRYDRNRGALDAELVFSDFDDLQAVREAVASRGGLLEEGASRQTSAGRIAGDVTVRLP